jgi:hypothetical protein
MTDLSRRSHLHLNHPDREARYRRKYGDKATAKYFVYFLMDAQDAPVYIGRSVNPKARYRAHELNQGNPNGGFYDTASWFPFVDHMDVVGPFAWDKAVSVEREEIGKHQPPANRDLTAWDHRPAVATVSRQIRDAYLEQIEAAA